MSNSPLVSHTNLSPNNSGKRTHTIDRITPHCVVGQCTVEALGDLFENPARRASSNYGIGFDGRIGLYVPEDSRSWCSGSEGNDQRAITIECASETVHPYTMTAAVWQSLIELCTDICRRYGKSSLLWFDDMNYNLNYAPAPHEMVLTVHRWFEPVGCPGDWLFSRMGELARTVTANLNKHTDSTIYRVQVGAFKSKSNAEAYLEKIKSAGFPDAFITTQE